jgi:endonuclease/exonuclease/phosphatase family metal-dependent hydrolase
MNANSVTEKQNIIVVLRGMYLMNKAVRKTLMLFGILFGIILLFFIGGILFLSITEYKPHQSESLSMEHNQDRLVETGKSFSVLSMNIGYAALDKDQDFFMDGGTGVMSASEQDVRDNLKGIRDFFENIDADILMLQEVDLASRRSYQINEKDYLQETIQGGGVFAYNFKVPFVPIPPHEPIGKVESGLLTINQFQVKSADRIALPIPFKWPVRTANLKRCLLVERLPISGSEKELILINLHLEAYDDGAGKAAQTKMLMDLLNAEYAKGNYCIAGGDFNQTFPGMNEKFPIMNQDFFAPGILSEDMLEPGWRFAFDGENPSCRLLNQPYSGNQNDTQYYIIDGFIVSPNVELQSVETINMDFEYSDHNPVKIEVVLKG